MEDFRLAIRRLIAAPLFSTFAVLSVAIGVGVTTIAYAIVDDVFFPGLGIPSAERVVVLEAAGGGILSPIRITIADFEQLRRSSRSLQSLAASLRTAATLGGSERTVLATTEAVSGEYFRTFGVEAAIGRLIRPDDERARAQVAVLGHTTWRDQFSSDPAIVGRTVRIGGRPFEIIGVVPEYFPGFLSGSPAGGTGAWVPLGAGASFGSPDSQGDGPEAEQGQLAIAGRLRAGTSVQAAAAELAAAGVALDASNPLRVIVQGASRVQPRGWTAGSMADLYAERMGNLTRLGLVVAALVFMVLAVACTNLANLVLARGTNRQQDFVVRRALGASNLRLVREQLSESLLIVVSGGLAAYVVMMGTAAAAARDLPLFAGRQTLSIRPHIDVSALVFAAVALVVVLLVSGLEPAVRLTRTADVRGSLAAATARMGRSGRYRMLLRWQIAASTAFFILAAIAIRYVVADVRHDPGLRLDGLVVAQLDFEATPGWEDERVRRVLQEVTAEAQRSPDVAAVAISSGLPFGSFTPLARISRVGISGVATSLFLAATPNFFSTAGVPIVRGRPFAQSDGPGRTPVVVVSETAARSLFGSLEVVGQELSLQVVRRDASSAEAVTIVGVAADTDTQFYLNGIRTGVVYAPMAQRLARPITVVARAADDETAALSAVQAAIRRVDPDLAVVGIGSGWDMLSGAATLARFATTSSLALGLLMLVFAMAGLYGIQSHGVALRRREIGVRLSFGATAAQIRHMVLKDGFRPVFEGLIIGLAFGIGGRAIIRAYVDVPLTVFDPWMLALVPIPLVLGALCACYLPARLAARVDPNVALRDL